MAWLQFRLIGAMEMRVDGAEAKLPGAAERALLALLLLSPGSTVPASSLIDRLWAEEAQPADPLNALQLRVSKLRRTFASHGVDVVTRETSGYKIAVRAEDVDLHLFTARVRAARDELSARGAPSRAALALYDEALGLWRGEPLADFAGQPWATVEAARLGQLRLAALTERAELALALGAHAEVAAELGPLVAEDPKHEALAALLMTALYRAGRQADALDVYTRTRKALDDELGLEPSPLLRALHQRVLEQDEGLAAVPAALAAGAGPGNAEPAPVEEGEPLRPAAVDGKAARGLPSAAALPRPAGALIGREQDVESVVQLLQRHRLVTLIGPGGAGKTALAVEVAQRLCASAETVHPVALASADAADPSSVGLVLADALAVPLDGADPRDRARDRVVSYLATRSAVLILDNCEHVVDEVARLVDLVLGGCPSVTVLATSREALAVRGEIQVAVSPLAVPEQGTPPEQVLTFAAPQLLVERARAVRSDLAVLEDDDLLAVADICRHLDGMPLAIELAAGRLSSLSLVELAGRLDDRFSLLTGGPRTADARQRTLRATVEWSHSLLSDVEQQAFRRLAVFQGGCTLQAAEAVVAAEGLEPAEVFDVLSRLVDRSMLVFVPGTPSRYRLLETLRQYAAEQLTRAGEASECAARHAAFYAALADDADTALRGSRQREALRRLREEHANVRAALTWLASDPARSDQALELAGALGLFWHLGRHVEGRDVLRRITADLHGGARARARALQAVSLVERPRACLVHPSPRCAETARASLELFEQAGDEHAAALSRVLLAVEHVDGSSPELFAELLGKAEETFTSRGDDWGLAVIGFVRLEAFLRSGDEARSRAAGRTASDAFRALDDPWGLSAVLYHLGAGLRDFGRYADSVPVLEEAIDLALSAGLHNTAQWALADLGLSFVFLGDHDAAAGCFARAATASREIGDAAGEALAAYGGAVGARARGDAAAARPLFVEAMQRLSDLGTPLHHAHAAAGLAWCELGVAADEARARYEQVLRDGERLGAAALVATAWEGLARAAALDGDAGSARQLVREAIALRTSSGRPAPPHERAELEALGLVTAG